MASCIRLENLPKAYRATVAVNDLTIQSRENDLLLGTHGRGVWILDQINALQELNAEVMASALHVFTMEPAKQIRLRGEKAHAGDMVFRGSNPAVGALVDFWLADAHDESVQLMVESFKRPDFREGVTSFLEKRPPKFDRV